MTASRSIVVAGAGIGGLTAALTLAAKGFSVTVLEKAERLEEAGAGLQLSPNASRVLIALGLRDRLAACAQAPETISMVSAQRRGEVARLPLGDAARRADAPYWVIHRADLQGALLRAVTDHPAIELKLGSPFEDVSNGPEGVIVGQRTATSRQPLQARALIGADGLWSAVRSQLFPEVQPRFSGLIAWRGTIDAERLPRDVSKPGVQLFLGSNAHLVAYPISGGRRINVVAIISGSWNRPGWSEPGDAADIQDRFSARRWTGPARTMVGAVDSWRRWALFTLRDGGVWNLGATALLGDAAHAMLPFAAQGAGMAIEDAAVLAQCLAAAGEAPADIPPALLRYAGLRRPRVTQVQRAARHSGQIYHLGGPAALARDLVMRRLGGARLLARQDWIYNWRP